MSEKKYYTQKELKKITGLRNSQINYLVQDDLIPCVLRGKGKSRLFPPEALSAIKNRQNQFNIKG